MFGLPAPNRVYLAHEPADMRMHHDGLWALAESKLKENPFGGALFVFTKKARDRVKMPWWDGSGVWVMAKRLEKGRFSWPESGRDGRLAIRPEALTMLLGGVDMRDGCRRAWFERKDGPPDDCP